MIDLHADLVRCALALHLDAEPEAIADDAMLDADLGLDPLDLVLIVLRLEELEECEFPVADLERIRTVADLIMLVRQWAAPFSRSDRSPLVRGGPETRPLELPGVRGAPLHERPTTLPPPPPRTESGFQLKGVIAPPRMAHR